MAQHNNQENPMSASTDRSFRGLLNLLLLTCFAHVALLLCFTAGCSAPAELEEEPPGPEPVVLQASEEVRSSFGIVEYEVLADQELDGTELVSSFRAYDAQDEHVADYLVTVHEQGFQFSLLRGGEVWTAGMSSGEGTEDSMLNRSSYAWTWTRNEEQRFTKRADFFAIGEELVSITYDLNGEEWSAELPVAEDFERDFARAAIESGAALAVDNPLASLAQAIQRDPAVAPYLPIMLNPGQSTTTEAREIGWRAGVGYCLATGACIQSGWGAVFLCGICGYSAGNCAVFIGEFF